MKYYWLVFELLFLSSCAIVQTPIVSSPYSPGATSTIILGQTPMKITSPDFNNGDFLPLDFSCRGQGRAPLLQISDVPAGTVSLVLIVDDPDAPAGVFTHWLAWNINAAETNLNPNNPPAEAVVGVNSAGSNKYVPPCPPRGIHHYYYRLYALDEKLNLSVKSQASQIAEAITGHIIAEAVIMGKVEKK